MELTDEQQREQRYKLMKVVYILQQMKILHYVQIIKVFVLLNCSVSIGK